MPVLSAKLIPAIGVAISAVLLFGFEVGWPGHLVLVLSLLGAAAVDRELVKDLLLIGVGITIVSTTSVAADVSWDRRSEEHTSELQSRGQLVCRLLLEKKNQEND